MYRNVLKFCICIAALLAAHDTRAQEAEPAPETPPATPVLPTAPTTPASETGKPPTETVTQSGDMLHIPLSHQGDPVIVLPARGLNMSAVRAQFGEPLTTSPAIGKPPITRWDYAQFMVTFEGETVIQAVRKHQPKHPVK